MGLIGFGKKKNVAQKKDIDDADFLLTKDTSFDVKESYNELRTNVMFSLAGEGCKKISFTSSVASEGKSTTCFNLAITFAELDSKVLVIDCDLRKPKLNKFVKLKETEGLSNYLIGKAKLDKIVHNSGRENLDVLLAGNVPPNPSELLSSPKMQEMVDELSKKYDYIFFDAPPITVVTDAAIISSLIDGFVVVVRHQIADKTLVKLALSKLDFVNAKIIGLVLNDVHSEKNKYGYYKYGYYRRGYYKYGYYRRSYYNQEEAK